jgi:hypothetical protein
MTVGSIFTDERFIRLGDASARQLYVAHSSSDGDAVGSLRCAIDGDRVVSGFMAPFGGPDLVGVDQPVDGISALLQAVEDAAIEVGAREIIIRARPASHGAGAAHAQFAMLGAGFAAIRADLNYAIRLDVPDFDGYLQRLKSPARRAYRSSQGVFAFAQTEDVASISASWALIRRNREARGRQMSLTEEYVRDLFVVLRDKALLFEVMHVGVRCAAAFVYWISPTVWYVQYWGDDPTPTTPRSPMNFLVAEVVREALNRGVKVIDVGATNEGLQANQGLIQFKKSVGGDPELRWVFAKGL